MVSYEEFGDPLAPAYYLTAISVIGFLVITYLRSCSRKSLKGSYPNVITSKITYMQNTKEAWWVKRRDDFNKKYKSIVYKHFKASRFC